MKKYSKIPFIFPKGDGVCPGCKKSLSKNHARVLIKEIIECGYCGRIVIMQSVEEARRVGVN